MKNKNKNIFTLKVLFYIALIIFFIILVISNISNIPKGIGNASNNEDQTSAEIVAPDITVKISAIGDIMCHGPNYQDAYNAQTKTYDFSTFFTHIKSYVSDSDLAIGNLETTFAGGTKAYSGYPTFNSPPQLAKDIQNMGIDVLTTSNNHSLDTGYNGLVNTLDELDKIGMAHTGTFRSEEEKDTILYKDVNGIKFAFLSYTYGTNGIAIPKGKEYCINLIDKELIKSQLDKAKEQNPDVICVSMHWGIEYKIKQNSEQEELANFLFENGVDIIFGSHPHVLEPMEKRTITLNDGTTKDGFVIYSLGNFCSNQSDKYTKDSIILNLQITKHSDGKISIDSYDYIPIYMQNNGANAQNRFEIIDLKKKIEEYEGGNSNVTKAQYNTYVSELKNITSILGEPEDTKKNTPEDTKKVSSFIM